MIRRGFEPCLIIYPMVEFKKVFSKISGLSEFNEEYRKLQRNFFSGTATVELDANGRFVIPKNMLGYAQLEKDLILIGMGNKVEVWNPSIYEKHLIKDPVRVVEAGRKIFNRVGTQLTL